MQSNPQVPWTDEQWARVNQAIQEEAQRARVAAGFLPLYGPLSPDTDFVREGDIPYTAPLTISDKRRTPASHAADPGRVAWRAACRPRDEQRFVVVPPRVPLSMASVDVVAEAIASTDVEAVAIVFLHAYINPAHEMAAAERLRALLPGVAVTASHEISRQWREYERSNTAVLSAYVQPVMAHYLANLSGALADQQIECRYYCMQSNGGLAEFEAAERAPLVLVESGPAGGVAGAVRIGEASARWKSSISTSAARRRSVR